MNFHEIQWNSHELPCNVMNSPETPINVNLQSPAKCHNSTHGQRLLKISFKKIEKNIPSASTLLSFFISVATLSWNILFDTLCFNIRWAQKWKEVRLSHWPHWQVYEETFFGCPEQLNRWHARKVVSVVINFLNMKIEIETNIWTKVRWEFIYKLFAQLNWLLFAWFCICICQFHDKYQNLQIWRRKTAGKFSTVIGPTPRPPAMTVFWRGP